MRSRVLKGDLLPCTQERDVSALGLSEGFDGPGSLEQFLS